MGRQQQKTHNRAKHNNETMVKIKINPTVLGIPKLLLLLLEDSSLSSAAAEAVILSVMSVFYLF